ncbi:MAG: hypothetical protein ACE5G0_15330 [Rhodothermales bacterium]
MLVYAPLSQDEFQIGGCLFLEPNDEGRLRSSHQGYKPEREEDFFHLQ